MTVPELRSVHSGSGSSPPSPREATAPPLPPIAEADTADAIDRAAAEVWIGKVIAGKYRVDKVIGRGGMGVVLRATHRSLGEPVAIKVLRASMMVVPGMVKRFTREARAASKIKGEHVVRVTDVDTLESGVPYMVMEYLEGRDLAATLREHGRLSIDLAVRCIRQACSAIAEAHANGIVHRDLKPGNLFLARRSDGREIIKVLDFGISKVEDPTEQDATRTGTMMGSPKFMAPEQMMSMHDVDGRADIWALGVILYNLLAGMPPFMAPSTPQVCSLVLNAEPIPPSFHRAEIPAELEEIVLRCLKKNPELRFSTASELDRALMPFAPAALSAEPSGEGSLSSSMSSRPPSRISSGGSAARPSPAPAQAAASADAGTSHTLHPTEMVSSVDTLVFAPRRRSPGVILGGLALVAAIALAAIFFFEQGGPVAASTAPPVSARALAPPAPVTAEPPSVEPSLALPAPSSSAEAVTAEAAAAPGAVSAPRPSAKRPEPSAARAKKSVTVRDPFGGSRN